MRHASRQAVQRDHGLFGELVSLFTSIEPYSNISELVTNIPRSIDMIDATREADDALSMSSCDWDIIEYFPSESDPAYDGRHLLSRALADWKNDLVGGPWNDSRFPIARASEEYVPNILYLTDNICIIGTDRDWYFQK